MALVFQASLKKKKEGKSKTCIIENDYTHFRMKC